MAPPAAYPVMVSRSRHAGPLVCRQTATHDHTLGCRQNVLGSGDRGQRGHRIIFNNMALSLSLRANTGKLSRTVNNSFNALYGKSTACGGAVNRPCRLGLGAQFANQIRGLVGAFRRLPGKTGVQQFMCRGLVIVYFQSGPHLTKLADAAFARRDVDLITAFNRGINPCKGLKKFMVRAVWRSPSSSAPSRFHPERPDSQWWPAWCSAGHRQSLPWCRAISCRSVSWVGV